MFLSNFSICGLSIVVTAPLPVKVNETATLFLSMVNKTADLVVESNKSILEIPAGAEMIEQSREFFISRQGEKIWRVNRAFKEKQPFSVLHYNLSELQKAQLYVPESEWEWAANPPWLWQNMALPQLLAPFGALILHASYIEVNGKAVLFTAASGTGKSTQAALWEKHRGAMICNGDKAGLRVQDGVLYAYGLPFCGTSGICHNVTLPVAAIVALSQAPENRVTVLTPAIAAQTVLANVYADRYIPEEWNRVLNLTLDAVSRVPVLHLACTPDERAVEVLEKYL